MYTTNYEPGGREFESLRARRRVMAYVMFQRKNMEQQGSGSSNAELKTARVELLQAQKKAADLALRQKTGQLLEADEVRAIANAGTAVFVGQKRSMGSRLAGTLAGMDNPKEILKLLNSENDKILSALSIKLNSLAARGIP